MLPAWLNQQLSAPVFFVELPHICFPLKEQWSTRPSSDQRWNMPALHGLVLLLPHCHSWMLSKGVLSGLLTFLRMTSSLTKFSHWEPEEKLEPSHCSTVCIMERPRNCFCQLLPEHLQLDPRLRRSVRSHDLAVQIPRSNLVSHKRSFVPSAARIWNSLPEYIPSLEKRACFKKEVNRYLGDN